MAMKISYEDLQIISRYLTNIKDDEFTKSLDNFLKDKKDDYYFHGRESDCVKTLEIPVLQLERIFSYIDSTKYKSIYENIKSIYHTALGSGQKIVFLHGRMR